LSSLVVTSGPVWAQSRRTGPEILYQKPSDASLTGGRTAVCFVDGNSEASAALREAIRSKKSEDKLIVIHFVDSEAPMFFDLPVAIVHSPEEIVAIKERVYSEAREMTLRYKSILEENQVSNVELLLMPCVRPQSRAVKFVGDVGAEVVYVGTHNLGSVARTFLGSFSHYVLHNTTNGCVVVARDTKLQAEEKRKKEASLNNNDKKKLRRRAEEAEEEVMVTLMQENPDAPHFHPALLRKHDNDDNNNTEKEGIDGFILVGPPSLP